MTKIQTYLPRITVVECTSFGELFVMLYVQKYLSEGNYLNRAYDMTAEYNMRYYVMPISRKLTEIEEFIVVVFILS
jgi:hypothetical protein